MIVCIDARSVDWAEDVLWSALLGPAGLLAFITHGDSPDKCSALIRGRLTSIFHRAGLIQLDKLTMPEMPTQAYAAVSLVIRPLPAVKGMEQEPR
ncbi:hypothetical protein GCM10018785_11710 [Streptomyces longispororuber]|uniref:Uncharacterized protein n=1 Tax=Streptomyces longispororuber TaxID=68230 RepID=A0A919DHV6_9ACTN|nr:hypothetical protein [Streptomyces longispororuber]GHE43782.1 hypothetical protein GCM10018785_11710 [Streptomyces longispororuber]